MATGKDIKKAAKAADATLARLRRIFDKELAEVMVNLNIFIQEQAAELQVATGGKVIRNAANIQRALNARAAIMIEAETQMAILGESWIANYEKIGEFAAAQLTAAGVEAAAFTAIDREIVRAFAQSTLADLGAGTNFVMRNMGTDILSTVLVEGDARTLAKKITARLGVELAAAEGIEVATGQSLQTIGKRLAHDSLMDLYRTVSVNKAREAQVKKFLYVGPDDDVTRDFCNSRTGQIWTEDEVNDWNGLTWDGQIPGTDVWVTLGGYNCRHSLAPIPDGINEDDL